MSTFIHGGSALVLDVAAKAHAALSRGDVVMIDPRDTADDGYTTMAVDALDKVWHQVAIPGVVLGSAGKSTFATGEDVLIRICGVVDAKLNTGATKNDAVKLTANNDYLSHVAAATGFTANASATFVIGTCLENGPGAGQALKKCFINAFNQRG